MRQLTYEAETPQKISALTACTPDDVQRYLQLCLEISSSHSAHNVLAFPYELTINPFSVFYRWLKRAKFRIHPRLTNYERKYLRNLVKSTVKELRSQNVDSTKIFRFDRNIRNPFLLHFSQIYALHLILDSLHVYNFCLENYIHESHQLRIAIQEDLQDLEQPWPLWCHRRFCRDNPAETEYNYWVRSFLVSEAIDYGQANFMQFMGHTFNQNFAGHHPVLNPTQHNSIYNVYLENCELANSLKHYRYYRFLQPTLPEQAFFHNLRNDQRDMTHQALLGAGFEKLAEAVELVGHVHQHIPQLLKHRSIQY